MQITIRLIDGELKTLRTTLEPLAEFFDLSGSEVYIGRRIAEFRPILNYLRGSASDIPDSSGPAAAAVGLVEEHGRAVAINVGGVVFHVSTKYIEQSTYFAGMLNWKKQNGGLGTQPLVDLTAEFIDRDPADFATVLAYLEGSSNPGSETERDYYGISLKKEQPIAYEPDTHEIMPFPLYADTIGIMGYVACESSQQTKGNYIGTTTYRVDISKHGKTCSLRCRIERSIDVIHKLAIEVIVTHARKPTIDECYELIDKIDILVGGQCMSTTTPTWLRIMKLVPIIASLGNNNYCIHIPLVTTFSSQQPFLLLAIPHREFKIEGHLNRPYDIHECNLIAEYGLLGIDERGKAKRDHIDQHCYTQLDQIEHIEGGEKTRIRLHLGGIPAGGLFLKSSADFTDVAFACNGYTINYMTKATLISHSLHHFGNTGEGIYGIQFGDMNISHIDNFECIIQHPTGKYTFEFYAKVKNVLRYSSGVCGMQYYFR